MGALGFLGGFSSAASQSQAQGEDRKLSRDMALAKFKETLANDKLRQAYLQSRLNKPPNMGAGIKLSKGGKGEVFYPATGAEVPLPEGTQFQQSQPNNRTKSWETFLDTESLNDDSFEKLSPPRKQALYQKFRSTMSPDQVLKDQVLRARLTSLGLSNAMTEKVAPRLMDLITKEGEGKVPPGTAADIVPGVSMMTGGGWNPGDTSTYPSD